MDITNVSKDKVKYTKVYIKDCNKESSCMFCWRMFIFSILLPYVLKMTKKVLKVSVKSHNIGVTDQCQTSDKMIS